jgi:hypothetical protein
MAAHYCFKCLMCNATWEYGTASPAGMQCPNPACIWSRVVRDYRAEAAILRMGPVVGERAE